MVPRSTRLLPLVLAFGLIALPVSALAQAALGGWAEPVNISRSGGTTNPRLISFDNGDLVTLWDDSFALPTARNATAGVARRTGGVWSDPALVTLPFAGRPFQLIAGRNGRVQVIWIDARGSLQTASAPAASFGEALGLELGRQIATSVIAFSAVLDEFNRIHLVYLRTDDTPSAPAGVYYTRVLAGTSDWSFPRAVYASSYYRQYRAGPANPAEIYYADAGLPGVDISVRRSGNAIQVLLGWENPALKRIFLLRSPDGGVSWGEIQEIDGPDMTSPYSAPRQPRVIAAAGGPLLLWQVAEEGGSCALVYATTRDEGATWSAPRPVLETGVGCPDGLDFLGSLDETQVFLLTQQGQISLLGWNGVRWSSPQGQQALDYFTDQTTFSFVEFGCRQASLSGDQLYVVGCDLGSGGDIWVTERILDDIDRWFDTAAGWVEAGSAILDEGQPLSLSLTVDRTGGLRALWAQENPESTASDVSNVFYASLGADGVSGPFLVLADLPGRAGRLTTALDSGNRLTAVWGGGTNGELSQSWTGTLEAGSIAGWSEPAALEGLDLAGRDAQLAVDPAGLYHLAYTIPVNEGRGVYLASSPDQGRTWEPAARVFDAAAAGCDLVEKPSLALDESGSLHLAWVCSTAPGGQGPLAFYYSRSLDGGANWSESIRLADRPASWGRLITSGGGAVHWIWQEIHGGRTSTWHMQSLDDGATWGTPRFISATEEPAGPAALAADGAGGLHLLQALDEAGAGPVLQHSLWDGVRWSVEESLSLRADHASEIEALAAAVDRGGRLDVVYLGPGPRASAGARQAEAVFASIEIGGPAASVVEPAGLAASPAGVESAGGAAPTLEPTATPLLPTPTLEFSAEPPGFSGGPLGIVAGLITAAVLAAAVFAFRARSR